MQMIFYLIPTLLEENLLQGILYAVTLSMDE